MSDELLEVIDLRKNFEGVVAVDGATFNVEAGETVGLIGPNGAGKSTIFNLITGFIKPTSGTVKFAGDEITGTSPHELHNRGLARSFQDTRLYNRLTVYENLLVSADVESRLALLWDTVSEEYIERAEELLDLIELKKVSDNEGSDLSFGQRKLVEFAALFMSDPRLALLDEPCGGVNPRLINQFKNYIRQLNDEGYTFLIIEHNMNFAMDICDRLVVLDHGTVLTTGPPEEIQQDEQVLNAYFGET